MFLPSPGPCPLVADNSCVLFTLDTGFLGEAGGRGRAELLLSAEGEVLHSSWQDLEPPNTGC